MFIYSPHACTFCVASVIDQTWIIATSPYQTLSLLTFLTTYWKPISLLPLKLLLSKLHWITDLGDDRNAAATGTLTSTIVSCKAPHWAALMVLRVIMERRCLGWLCPSSFLQVETSQTFNQVTLSRVNLSERSSRIFRHIASYFRAFFLSHF